ncbi:acyl-CoA synthetase (AMP-forming)/AMP-acid ligase II [Bradyrhizobium sp. USDA 4472]
MERIWLKQYPPGVPADIEPTQYASLVDLLEESFTKFAGRKAFICMDKAPSPIATSTRCRWRSRLTCRVAACSAALASQS